MFQQGRSGCYTENRLWGKEQREIDQVGDYFRNQHDMMVVYSRVVTGGENGDMWLDFEYITRHKTDRICQWI